MSLSSDIASVKSIPSNIDVDSFLSEKQSIVCKSGDSKGISGFVFDVAKEESVELSSDITDHYMEDNSFINDHVVLKPEKITLSGFVGELVYSKSAAAKLLSTVQSKLATVDSYTGGLTQGATQAANKAITKAQSAAASIGQTIAKAKNVIDYFTSDDSATQTRQQSFYISLKGLWKSKSILDVQTPWELFSSMMIESISFSQDDTTQEITDISVTLKKVRFAATETTDFDENQFPPRSEIQSAEESNIGEVAGSEVSKDSIAYQVLYE